MSEVRHGHPFAHLSSLIPTLGTSQREQVIHYHSWNGRQGADMSGGQTRTKSQGKTEGSLPTLPSTLLGEPHLVLDYPVPAL